MNFIFFFINFNLFDFPQRPTFVEFDFPTQGHLIQYQLLNSPFQIHLVHLLIQLPIVHCLKKKNDLFFGEIKLRKKIYLSLLKFS